MNLARLTAPFQRDQSSKSSSIPLRGALPFQYTFRLGAGKPSKSVREAREWGEEHGLPREKVEALLDRFHTVWRS